MHTQATAPQSSLVELKVKRSDHQSRGLERRRFPRLDSNLSAFVNVAEHSFAARCLNLSAGGALLKLDSTRALPETFLLHLVMPVLGDIPVPIIARRVEVLGRRVRLAFDPLPGPLAKAVARQLLSQLKPAVRSDLLN